MLSRAPVFILGDLRQPGMDYARRFFNAVQGFDGAVIVEFFYPVDRAYAAELAAALPNFLVEFSPESHDPAVRRASGKGYSNQGLRRRFGVSAVGARRFDLFFDRVVAADAGIGLRRWITAASVGAFQRWATDSLYLTASAVP